MGLNARPARESSQLHTPTRCLAPRRSLVVATTALIAYGCTDQIAAPDSHSIQGAVVPSAATASLAPDFNERQAQLSESLHGYGGHYRHEGNLFVWIKGASSSTSAIRTAIGDFRRAGTLASEARAARRQVVGEPVVVLEADYTFRELYEWYLEIGQAVWQTERVTFTDIDERLNRIEVGVSSIADIVPVRSVVTGVGVPPEAVVIVENSNMLETDVASMQGNVSPEIGGIQISLNTTNACSMAFSSDRTSDGNWYFVTAAHCTQNYAQMDGDTIGQPWVTTPIGYEVADPAGFTSSPCPPSRTCRESDAALIRYTTWNFLHGHVAWPNLGSTNFSTTAAMDISTDVEVGDSVHLVGRTTGRSAGEVLDTCVGRDGPVAGYHLTCLFLADYTRAGGDSGGAVVWVDPADPDFRAAAGIHSGHIADTAAFSTTRKWMDEMEADYGQEYCVYVWCAPNPIVTIDGPSVVPSTSEYCTWTASVTRGVPGYTYTWWGVASGSGDELYAPVSGEGYLYVEVEDGVGHTNSTSLYITIDSEATPPECSE